MNRQELIENYTIGQLADMIAKLQEELHEYKLEPADGFFYISSIIPHANKDAMHRINKTHSFEGIYIITNEIYKGLQDDKNTYKKLSQTMENKVKYLKNQLYHKENEISELKQKLERQEVATKYTEEYVDSLKNDIKRKETTINQIDSIICELFEIAHNGDEYTEEFKELLRNQSVVGKTIADFLPTEPIKVADMLINAEIEPREILENGEEAVFKPRKFYISELRQIAEHLLIYCNANGEVE